MDATTPQPPAPRLRLRVTALAGVLLVWLLGVFGTSAQLHGALHHGVGELDHVCAITLFRDGTDQSLERVALLVAPHVFPAGEAATVPLAPIPAPARRLPPGCGPPLC